MRRTKAEAAETRAAILAAAETVFFEKGVARAKLDEIACRAKVTRGAIYWHFESKTDLFLELYTSVRLPKISMLDIDRAEQCGDVLEMLERLATDWLELLANDEQRQRMLTILLRTNFTGEFEPVAKAIAAMDREDEETIGHFFDRAERKRLLREPWTSACASRSFRWLMKGLCWEWLLASEKFNLTKLGSESIHTFFVDLRAVPLPAAN